MSGDDVGDKDAERAGDRTGAPEPGAGARLEREDDAAHALADGMLGFLAGASRDDRVDEVDRAAADVAAAKARAAASVDPGMPLIRIGHVDDFRPKVESVIDDIRWRPPTARELAIAAGAVVMCGLLMAVALSHLVLGATPTPSPRSSPSSTSAPATPASTVPASTLPTAASAGYRCTGGANKIFDNWNGGAVQVGGTPVTFSTNGKAYCLVMIATYHWNNGKGALPGLITVSSSAGSLTAQSVGTNGQNNVPDANWVANFPAGTEPLLYGSYTCGDSEPATWAQNDASTHLGFCRVWASDATPIAASATLPPAASAASPVVSTVTPAPSSSAAASVAATPATPANSPLPWFVLLFVGGAGLMSTAGWLVTQLRESGVDCSELRRRCEEARIAANAARDRAQTAHAKASSAHSAYAQAKAAREKAAAAAAAADHPDEGTSWVEDSETHERITEHDLALERDAHDDRWGDPAARAERRAQEKQRAHDALAAATRSEEAARRAADDATAQAAAAAADAKRADDAAREACLAADECEQEEMRLRAKAKSDAERARHGADLPPAVDTAPPPTVTPPPVAPPPPPPVTPPVAPPVVAPPTTQTRHECEDGDEPRVDVVEKDFELYLVWAGKWDIAGAFAFNERDVADALAGFKKFKTIVDIATFVQGFAGAGGDAAVGDINPDAVLNIFTTGADRLADYADQPSMLDPSGAAGWGVEKALDAVIPRVNRLRGVGRWSLTCPLVKVHATCTRTYECQGNRWALTKHEFKLEYGDKIRDRTLPEGGEGYLMADQTNVERGSREARRILSGYFNNLNRPVMEQIKQMIKSCAAP